VDPSLKNKNASIAAGVPLFPRLYRDQSLIAARKRRSEQAATQTCEGAVSWAVS
jgi:hypothetical protein